MKKLTFTRKIAQVFFLICFIYILWSTTYPLSGEVSPKVIFQLDPLTVFLTSLSERIIIPGFIFALAMIVLTLLLGRFFCGWICPLGTLIDVFGKFKKNKAVLVDERNRKLSRVKFFVLGIMAVFAVWGIQTAWTLDPIVLLARVISLNVIPAVTLFIDKAFVFFIRHFEAYGAFYDFYRDLKSAVLGVNVHFFANSVITFVMFVLIGSASLFLARAWCRFLCPLGGLYSFFSKFALLERHVDHCSSCHICVKNCRMGAINTDNSYLKRECILCMDCIYDCPERSTEFKFFRRPAKTAPHTDDHNGMTRRNFLFLIGTAIPSMGMMKMIRPRSRNVIRPPGVLEESRFSNMCVRCGNCMKVCITNGLQPSMAESGPGSIWTPKLVPEIGYCEYNCNLCGQVCPTGAIPDLALSKKKTKKLGIAQVDRPICYAWGQKTNCLVCEEHCPVPDKAIKVVEEIAGGEKILKPVVDRDLCIGCGICQNKCPIRPVRAIRVKK